MSMFKNRAHAAALLAGQLECFGERGDVLVLALPRGGVPIGYGVAMRLGLELDVLVVRKLGHPSDPDLALGAIALGGVQVIDDDALATSGVDPTDLIPIIQREAAELARREAVYRGDRPPPRIRERAVLLMDDGIATGATLQAGIEVVRRFGPREIFIAVPVAPALAVERFRREVNEVHVVHVVHHAKEFRAVSQFYETFNQVSDGEVCRLLRDAWNRHEKTDVYVPLSQRAVS
jgi:putative phosphoribosyl transferase